MKGPTPPERPIPLVLFVLFAFAVGILFCILRDVSSGKFMSAVNQSFLIVENTVDSKTVLEKRIKAVILILTRDQDLYALRQTLIQFEDRFNSKYHYPYVFLNDKPFSDQFKQNMSQILMERYDFGKLHPTRNVSFGIIPVEHWSYPEWIDQTRAAAERKAMEAHKVLYGGVESYRHMCRFFSGFFYRHPLLAEYDYYWRVEPGVEFYCDIDYDPFAYMMENGKEYGFTITLPEITATIPTLWSTTKKYLKEVYPVYRKERSMVAVSPAFKLVLRADNSTIRDKYITDLLSSQNPNEEDAASSYHSVSWSTCHYWDNFEIARLSFFRSPLYQSYFDYLDKAGGFFYERWGDAPVRSLAVAMFLESSQVHFFKDIGYRHNDNWLCPKGVANCFCNSNELSYADTNGCIDLWRGGQES